MRKSIILTLVIVFFVGGNNELDREVSITRTIFGGYKR